MKVASSGVIATVHLMPLLIRLSSLVDLCLLLLLMLLIGWSVVTSLKI